MGDVIEMTLPVKPELMTLVRFAAATLAAHAEFSVEEIEDLRLAADEICLSVTDGSAERPMRLRLASDGDSIEISCTVHPDDVPASGSESEWSLRILDALVDEHGRESVEAECTAWLRKRRGRSLG